MYRFSFIALIFIGCNTSPQHSTDFTKENLFTTGVEGPAVNANGDLFAVNIEKEGTIGIVNSEGEGKIYLELPEGSTGNGIRFDKKGNMFIADYAAHNVLTVKKGIKTAEVWAHNPAMNQPNDLAISPTNVIYLSDPNWKESTGNLWMVNASKEIVLLEENMGTTNGIEVSPDGKKLYVNESVQRNVWQYDINKDGSISNKTKLIVFDDFGLDGMRCDEKGNLYIARYGKGIIAIISPEGKIIEEVILTGKKPTNITFGGKDGKTCFVTMQSRGSIETFKAKHAGSYFKQIH
ncbi:MAG: SMP-30/gluconolactonase/LRE family protein [Cellulophaga sp.]